jgi:hypothetical protein
MDRIFLENDGQYSELVNDVESLGKLIYDQLYWAGETYPLCNDPDSFQGMKNNVFPSRNTNLLIQHLYPLNNSVGAKKLVVNQQVTKALVATITPQKIISSESRKRKPSELAESSGEKIRKCYNCMQPGHEANSCDLACRSAKCLGLPGAITHSAKNCPIRAEFRATKNVRRY